MPNSIVVITRPVRDAQQLKAALEKGGFEAIEFPLIEVNALALSTDEQQQMRSLANQKFDWVVFTSANSVRILHQRMLELNLSWPEKVKVAAQGSKTAQLYEQLFLRVAELVPEDYISEVLAQELKKIVNSEMRVLIPCAKKTRGIVAKALGSKGVKVEELVLYETKAVKPSRSELEKLLRKDPSTLMFSVFSPSAFDALLGIFKDHLDFLAKASFASIGPITSQAIISHGFKVDVEASDHTDQGLIRALVSNQ